MEHYNLVVIGGDGAGMGSASQARRVDRDLSIAVFEKGNFVSYAGCGIPYYISGIVPERDSLLAVDLDEFMRKRNIVVKLNSPVTSIDFESKKITVKGSDTYSYDKLIIATGASPFIPPIPGIDSPEVYVLRTLQDGIDLHNKLSDDSVSSVTLIGGGFINLELAEAFSRKNIKVNLVEKLDSVGALFSSEIQDEITRELEKHKVNVVTGAGISEIKYENNKTTVCTDKGDFTSDFIIVSTGVRPNTGFIKSKELKTMDNGAILINKKSETSIKCVYAAGDCASVFNILTEKDDYIPMATTANKQGRVAGLQAAGVKTEIFPGSIGSQMFKVFDLEVAKTGFNLKDAVKLDIDAEEKINIWHSRAGYFPGTEELIVKITVNKKDGTVIGGEICGKDYAGLRINTIATAVAGKMKITDLAYLDAAYAPPFSPVWDPVLATAQKFIKRVPDW